MRRVLLLGLTITFAWAPLVAEENKAATTDVAVETADRGPAVKRIFARVWARLRAYIPRPAALAPTASGTQIAGVRGAEATSSGLQPYWKGDKTSDPAFVEEAEIFVAAVELAEAGEFQQAAAAFKAFSVAYPDSKLSPNVQFALGVVYGQLGNTEEAVTTLKAFARSHPTHPLAEDARQVITGLQER